MKTKEDLIIPHPKEKPAPAFLDRFFYLPKRGISHEHALQFNWPSLFQNNHPVFMEICSGNGQWIGECAAKRKDLNWVAVEFDFIRARKIWLKSFRENLPNLYVVCAEANTFLRYYAPLESVEEAFVNFPDPWPKRRHAPNRLIQTPFADNLKRVLKRDGFVTLATDDPPYKEQMVQVFSKNWDPILVEQNMHGYGDSFFASLWKSKGKELFYLKYRKQND